MSQRKATYSNPDLEIEARPFLNQNETSYNLMLDLVCEQVNADKNSEFKFCLEHLFVSKTRAGSNLHRECKKTYSAKQLKGNNSLC